MSAVYVGNPYILAGRYDNLPVSECKDILDGLNACIARLYTGHERADVCIRREALIHRLDNA